MTHPTRLLLVEDHLVMRAALRLLLQSQPGLEVVGEAETCEDALALAQGEQPDLILLDLLLRESPSFDSIPQFIKQVPGVRVLMLTSTLDISLHRLALARGAHGLVRKEQSSEVLFEAIQCVMAGGGWIEPALTPSVNGEDFAPELRLITQLTAREREVIQLIGEGLRNRQIAERLKLSERTVENHLASIFGKLEVRDRLELATFARRYDLLL
jgi:DNA-binding NarL/FixJ family response regulator